MANLFHYLKEVTDLSFYDQAPNEVDFLILTEIGYLPFNNILRPSFKLEDSLRLSDLAEAYFAKMGEKPLSSIVNKNRLQLLKVAASSKRFKNIKALAFVDDYSLDLQKQFSALTYRLMTDHFLIAFRGTDDTLIGWKEDFHMTYMKEIPAQSAATAYLQNGLTSLKGHFHLAGHSKGGNLALFAASHLSYDHQDRIKSLTTYDAPGLHRDIMTSTGYLAIKDRVTAFIPQDSVVGMMLETPDQTQVVKSKALGLLQHLTFSWEIRDGYFAPVDHITAHSRQTDQTLSSWSKELNDQELKDFFDAFFGIFLQAGIERLTDFEDNPPQKILAVIKVAQALPNQDKELLHRLIKRLFDTYLHVLKSDLPLPNWTEVENFFKKNNQ